MHRARFWRAKNKHSSGHSFDECGDPATTFYPQRHVCYAEMELAAAQAKYSDDYGSKFHDGTFTVWADQRSEHFPYSGMDGVTFAVSKVDHQPTATWNQSPEKLPFRGMRGESYKTPEPEAVTDDGDTP